MSERFNVVFAPHIASEEGVPRIMYFVIMSLLPAAIVSVVCYGLYVLLQYSVGILSAMLFEWLFCKIQGRPSTLKNCSAVVTGMLLVMTLPPSLPLLMTIMGSFVAIVIGKMVFGGLGQNPFNPALVGRMALLVSFPAQMTYWVKPNNFINTGGFFVDTMSCATVLGEAKTAYASHIFDKIPALLSDAWFSGGGGSIGEVSAIALILGGLFLIYKKVISWRIPVYFIGTVFISSGAIWLFNRGEVMDPFSQIFSGGVILGAFFMATDYSSSPLYNRGKILFALGCGILTVLIRIYGGYPEGVGFSILIMNAIVPLLDKYLKPEPFGLRHD